jgi:hypothetical protein
MEPTSACTRILNVGETIQTTNKGVVGQKMSSSCMSDPILEMKVLPQSIPKMQAKHVKPLGMKNLLKKIEGDVEFADVVGHQLDVRVNDTSNKIKRYG